MDLLSTLYANISKMMVQMAGSFVEFKREMIRERTKAELDAAQKAASMN